ncbi:protein kinase domain containing protein [Entamoeba histolytica HM-1:IMSS-B]|uniref:Protein kinase domain containing protein n=6 Tax=Entamoeba histolytica TaxID=5759 RepID=C4LZE4_ENTH1|nr:protein kinase domain containing protein [Entamoeba histolytica HM-1:IMSS]EMD44057.1 protein kinase domain containing protein [Entamoeba histolytica KU27]EMH77479.1 protein kinase domain containing protein [Entamoeba histolytica HM-1:IMSS-B]EMS13155.1 protein kinase domain containing protein [Entamoeba histolytica HM-3:IMSS]ENY65108.1 protein kinase domain containing protein [Entamoeba histolytica HM-1:IMSS-A]GAT94229.1 protein kinase domain containing protein [Entamoeba histolytica]|eukprot:XP_654053.2 protein kinase domain containing protein [Entamoeba histolytica HM-1:IMSS]
MEFYVLIVSLLVVSTLIFVIITKNKQQILFIKSLKYFNINEPAISITDYSKIYHAQANKFKEVQNEFLDGYDGFIIKLLLKQLPPQVIHKSMKYFEEFHHKNLLEVYAYQTTPPILIEGYCHRLSLNEFVQTNHPNLHDQIFYYDIALDILNGLKYLHSNGVVHGNVSPSNVLVTNDYQMKLSDPSFSCFSRMSQFLLNSSHFQSHIPGMEYCSPETQNKFTTPSSDVFSFGMVMAFVLLRKPLQTILGRDVEIKKKQHLLVSLESQEIELIVKECTSYEPYRRPPVSLLIQHITNLKINECQV